MDEHTVDERKLPALENDAFMFTVQVEFKDKQGLAQRYQGGVKYHPANHGGEVVTMFG